MKPKTFLVSYELYPFDVLVTTGDDAEVLRQLKRRGYEPDDEKKQSLVLTGRGRTTMLKGGGTVVRLKYPPNNPERIGVLTHEVFHAVFFLFDRINIQLCHQSDEAFAYAIEYLTLKIIEGFKK